MRKSRFTDTQILGLIRGRKPDWLYWRCAARMHEVRRAALGRRCGSGPPVQ